MKVKGRQEFNCEVTLKRLQIIVDCYELANGGQRLLTMKQKLWEALFQQDCRNTGRKGKLYITFIIIV